MKYNQASILSKSLQSGVQVKHLSAPEYVQYINLKRKLIKYFDKIDGAGQQLVNEYNQYKQVVTVDHFNVLHSEDKTFFEKLEAIRKEGVELELNFIEKIEVFKAVFENCENQELLYELLFKNP